MIIQNMAYVQQMQKQETKNSNIMNPKTKLTKGDLKFFDRNPDPFFFLDFAITSD